MKYESVLGQLLREKTWKMGRRNRGCKPLGSNALHAGQRKRQRVEHVGQEHIHHMLLRNCSNCKRTELHQQDESLSLTRISESDIQQNKKGKFSMLAGGVGMIAIYVWNVGSTFVEKSWFTELSVELYGHLLFGNP